MRSQRSYMVQTAEQYMFVYSALTEHTLFGNTEFEMEEIDHILEENYSNYRAGSTVSHIRYIFAIKDCRIPEI